MIIVFLFSVATSYKKMNDKHACCISYSSFHQRCNCAGPLLKCEQYCDSDPNCKGYVVYTYGQPSGKCNMATTSICPSGCSTEYGGNVGNLVEGATCGYNYGGCYIKQFKG